METHQQQHQEQPRKQIAIDTVFFNRSYSGITRVWENILEGLLRINPQALIPLEYDITLLIRGVKIPEPLTRFTSKYKCVNIPDFQYPLMAQDVDILNHFCKKLGIDYFISTYFTYCTEIPNILLIHDMIPEIFALPPNHMWEQKNLAIKNAAHFIVISDTTKRDLLRYHPWIETSAIPIHKIYNSIPSITNLASNPPYDDQFFTILSNKFHLKPGKYIFSLATNNEDYKNIALLKHLFAKYGGQLASVLMVPAWAIVIVKEPLGPEGYKFENGVLYLAHVPDKALNTLYKNALCYINPSRYEGFGLPVFEAFNHKIPVIGLDLPIYEELAPGAIHYISGPNDVDELFEKISMLAKPSNKQEGQIKKKIEKGCEYVARYNIDRQSREYHELFSNLGSGIQPRVNIICQSYKDANPARMDELCYCITRNLENPYVRWVHDFGYNTKDYLPDTILKHPKYISVLLNQNHSKQYSELQAQLASLGVNLEEYMKMISSEGYWLRYSDGFIYSLYKTFKNASKYGNIWGIINCDIFLDSSSRWDLLHSWVNGGYILAQSRHEYTPSNQQMDSNFAKMYHATTQDGWFYLAGEKLYNRELIEKTRFEIGMLGCDNAIADRLVRYGRYKVINKPVKFKLMHYDSIRGKTSDNFLEIHSKIEAENGKNKGKGVNKPKNSHPERDGCYLVPNYDQMLGENVQIDVGNMIQSLGGISNWEIYKLISEMFSSRIKIYNP